MNTFSGNDKGDDESSIGNGTQVSNTSHAGGDRGGPADRAKLRKNIKDRCVRVCVCVCHSVYSVHVCAHLCVSLLLTFLSHP